MESWDISDISRGPLNELILQIIFFGAPHKGLNTDALRTLVGGQPSAALVNDLTPGSGVLVNLNEMFAEKLARAGRDVKILTVVERLPTKTVVQNPDGSWTREGPEILMVDRTSGVLNYGKETILEADANHSQIAKLYNSESNVYYDVQNTITSCVAAYK
ncbi:MAG: hypothetical protein M1830_009838 [Pleopsidium flavum]|nr:MAG: hypothetical protein M1830_009838 [Pleopsidium flavum]